MLRIQTCRQCGQLVIGQAISACGAFWHPEHLLCAGCGRRIRGEGYADVNGQPYHAACVRLRMGPRCGYCTAPLSGRYLVDYWGTPFCSAHQGQCPVCRYCSRIIPASQVRAAGTGAADAICGLCVRVDVTDIGEAQRLFVQNVEWLKRLGLDFMRRPLHVELCGPDRLAHLLGGPANLDTLGVTFRRMRLRNNLMSRVEIDGVAVLSGLPSTLFEGVAVHELGHVWLAVQQVMGLPTWAEEGFCNTLAYRRYREIGSAESTYHAAGLERSADPVYGEGFRRVQSIVDKHGMAQVLRTIATTKRLPPG
jgi:hypothetical protein